MIALTAERYDRLRAALVPIDTAFWASEQKWGVGRLERLQSPEVLASYRRGWDAYRVALDDCDPDAVQAIGPKMIAALAFMDGEASAAGNKPLAPETWETRLGDGTVLVVVRTEAEQAAVLRASHASQFTGFSPNGNVAAAGHIDDKLPVDVATTIRDQHEGRRLDVWTMTQLARLVEKHGSVVDRLKWEGEPVEKAVQMEEGAAADIVRQGYPLDKPLTGDLGF
jgi:hypothetical protein